MNKIREGLYIRGHCDNPHWPGQFPEITMLLKLNDDTPEPMPREVQAAVALYQHRASSCDLLVDCRRSTGALLGSVLTCRRKRRNERYHRTKAKKS